MSNAKVRARRRRRARTATPQPVRIEPTPWTEEQRAEAQRLIEELPRIPLSTPPLRRLQGLARVAALASIGAFCR
jgi:hypothetical protein